MNMNVQELKAALAVVLDSSGIDSNRVFSEANMALWDTAEDLGGAQICVDDAFCVGYALAVFMHTDVDGGVGPRPDAVPNLPLTGATS